MKITEEFLKFVLFEVAFLTPIIIFLDTIFNIPSSTSDSNSAEYDWMLNWTLSIFVIFWPVRLTLTHLILIYHRIRDVSKHYFYYLFQLSKLDISIYLNLQTEKSAIKYSAILKAIHVMIGVIMLYALIFLSFVAKDFNSNDSIFWAQLYLIGFGEFFFY